MNHNKLPSKESESPLQIAENLWGMVSSGKYSPKRIEEMRHPDSSKRALVESYGLPSDDLSGIRVLDGLGSPFIQEAPDGMRRIGWCHLHTGGPLDDPIRCTYYATLTYRPDSAEAGALRIRTIVEGGGSCSNTVAQYSPTDDYGLYTEQLRRLEGWVESSFNHEQEKKRMEQERDSAKRGYGNATANWILRKLGIR